MQTDMGGRAAQFLGLDAAPVTIGEAVCGIAEQVIQTFPLFPYRLLTLFQIDTAEKSTTSGEVFSYKGERVAW